MIGLSIIAPHLLMSDEPAWHPPKSSADHDLPTWITSQPVLVVEDEAIIAWALESMLEDLGFKTVHIASSGADAVRLAERETPGLILSDINLGADAMDGVAAASAIRIILASPIIFITAHADGNARSRIDASISGAPILRKPVELRGLRDAIWSEFGKRDAH